MKPKNYLQDGGIRDGHGNENNGWRRGEASDAQVTHPRSRVKYLPKFNEDVDELDSSHSDNENGDTGVFSPFIQIKILSYWVMTLVDSGSEISATSEDLYNKICCYNKIPAIPTTNVSIAGAIGGKRQQVKLQVLLPIVIEKIDSICDVKRLVIRNLNCDLLPGVK
nr:unnamed protein product [Callosobruchus chinensis]